MTFQSLTSPGDDVGEPAFAKLNLGLKVLSRRQDGFHDLIGLFQTVSLHDTLHLAPAASLGLTCSVPAVPDGPANLAWRAAELYLREAGGPTCHIALTKRIPAGAGLGGGSADAAAVLRVLDHRASRPLGHQALAELATRLGSDVPFALRGGTALVEGRGERLQALTWDAGSIWYVLVCPPEPVDTGWAYAELDRAREAGTIRTTNGLSDRSPYLSFLTSARGGRVEASRLWQVVDNDFQALVERARPIVARASQLLAGTEPLATTMSGSGSTVYGIYDDRTVASRAADRLRAAGYPVFLCTPVPAMNPTSVARSFNW